LGGEAEGLKGVVEVAAHGVEEPAPGHGGHGGGHGGGEEKEGAEEGHPRVRAPDQKGRQKAQEELQGHHHEGEEERGPHAFPKGGVGQHLAVVLQTAIAQVPAEEVLLVKGKLHRLAQRHHVEEEEEPEGGEDEAQGPGLFLAPVRPGPRA
jgi:hypothetical protein